MSLRSHAVCKHAPSHCGGEQPEAGWDTSRRSDASQGPASMWLQYPADCRHEYESHNFLWYIMKHTQPVVSVLSRERPLSRYPNGVCNPRCLYNRNPQFTVKGTFG